MAVPWISHGQRFRERRVEVSVVDSQAAGDQFTILHPIGYKVVKEAGAAGDGRSEEILDWIDHALGVEGAEGILTWWLHEGASDDPCRALFMDVVRVAFEEAWIWSICVVSLACTRSVLLPVLFCLFFFIIFIICFFFWSMRWHFRIDFN